VGITILINVFLHVRKIFGQDRLQGKIVVDAMVQTDLRFDFYRKSYDRFTIRRRIWNSGKSCMSVGITILDICF
jgi:hypothetical protein